MIIKGKRWSDFKQKKILAIDYGQKIVGLASYTPGDTPFPCPAGRIIYQSDAQVISELKKIIDEEVIDIIVLGIPRLLDGKETAMTKKVIHFSQLLNKAFPKLSLFEQDETLSTFAAEERMKSDPAFNFKVDLKRIDEVAATIILEEFINQE